MSALMRRDTDYSRSALAQRRERPLKCNGKGQWRHLTGGTYPIGLAAGVEVGQAVEALVVLREAAEAKEESPHAHFHQHSSLVANICGQGCGHLDRLRRGLRLPFALAGRSLGRRLLRVGGLWWGGRDRRRMRTRFHGRLGVGDLREGHHHGFDYFLDYFVFRLDAGISSM